MATFIDTVFVNTVADLDAKEQCHFLPCTIDHDSDAKVSQFFTTTISGSHSDDKDLTASLRGRPLNGAEIKIPEGYTGLVLKEKQVPSTEDEDRHLTASHKFNKFTAWNLDKLSTSDDSLQKALQWIDIASTIHQPVSSPGTDSSQTSQGDSQMSLKGD